MTLKLTMEIYSKSYRIKLDYNFFPFVVSLSNYKRLTLRQNKGTVRKAMFP